MIVLLLLIASAKASQGKGRGSKLHPPLIHPALQPSSPMLLRSRFMFVIVLLLLIAAAKASRKKGRGSKSTHLSATRPYSPRRRSRCPGGQCA